MVGFGYWGEKLARVIQNSTFANLRWCCDISESNLETAKKLFPATNVTTKLYDVLKDKNVSAVIIATPAKSHYMISKEALLAGKHVLVEKPITTNVADVKELISLAKKKKKILMTDHIFLYNSAIMKIKEMINKTELGNIYYGYGTYAGPGPIRSDFSVIWDLAIHFLYTFSYLLNGLPKSVSAAGKSYLSPDNPDIAFLNLEYKKNIYFNLRVSWMHPIKTRSLVVVGDKKTIVFDDTLTDKIVVYDKGITPSYKKNSKMKEFVFNFGDIIQPHLKFKEPLAEVFSQFMSSLQSRQNPKISASDIVNIIVILEAAEYSLRNEGLKVQLKYNRINKLLSFKK